MSTGFAKPELKDHLRQGIEKMPNPPDWAADAETMLLPQGKQAFLALDINNYDKLMELILKIPGVSVLDVGTIALQLTASPMKRDWLIKFAQELQTKLRFTASYRDANNPTAGGTLPFVPTPIKF